MKKNEQPATTTKRKRGRAPTLPDPVTQDVYDMTGSDIARMYGVSRQAVSKWRRRVTVTP
jgi:DNA-binding transcriptional regulator YiaG